MTFPDAPSPDKVLRFRESELRIAAEFWHADPSEDRAARLHDAVRRLQDAQDALVEAAAGDAAEPT